MSDWIALSPATLAQARFLPGGRMAHTAGWTCLPVLLAELRRLFGQYVLGFQPRPDGAAPQLVAVLGRDAATGRHHYLDDEDRWLSPYVPALLRSFPFQAYDRQDGQQGMAIHRNGLSDDPDIGEPIFDAGGGLGPETARYADFLALCAKNRKRTDRAVAQLHAKGLLRPWAGMPDGLLQLDADRFDALPPEEIAALAGAPLAIAYAQSYSEAQTQQVFRTAAGAEEPDDQALKDYFGDGVDDELVFRFDR